MERLPKFILLSAMMLFLITPLVTFAQTEGFVSISGGLPGIDPNASTEDYLNALFALSIGIAAVLAVIKIIMAGVTLMTSQIAPQRGDAKSEIIGALIGLLLVLGALTMLNEINPNLTSLGILKNAPEVTITGRTEPVIIDQGSPTGTRSCRPVQVAGTRQTQNETVTRYATWTEAQDAAMECGGTARLSDGVFEASCPRTGGVTNPNISQQMTGWPVACAMPEDAGQMTLNCSSAGGSPSTRVTGVPPQTVVYCYR